MKLDLRTFKKVHEDGDKAVLRHADGHEIHISKDKLSPEQGIQLQSLPFHAKAKKMADGGPVDDPSISSEEWKDRWGKMGKGVRKAYADGGDVEPTGFDRLKERFGMAPSEPEAAEPTGFDALQARLDGPQVNVAEQPQEATPFSSDPIQPYDVSAQAPAQGFGAGDQSLARAPAATDVLAAPGPAHGQDALARDSSQYAQGAKAGADAEGQLGREQASMQDQLGQQQAALQAKFEEGAARIQNDRAKIKHDMENNLIDPNRYLGKQSTAGTVLSAIGLLLGGLGQGGGGENMALKTMDAAIAQDIEAQKANMGQRQSLLEANFKEYGDLESASKMTAINMRDVAISHLEAAASRSKDPVAAARAQMAVAEFKSKNDKEAAELAIKRSEADVKVDDHKAKLADLARRQALLKGGNLDQGNLIEAAASDPKQKERLYKELGTKQEAENLQDFYKQQFDHLHEKSLNGAFSPADRQSAIQATIGRIQKQSEGRYNLEAATQLAEALYPNKIESGTTSTNKKERGLDLLNSLSSTPELDQFNKQYGFDSHAITNKPAFKALPPEQQGFATWAQKNANGTGPDALKAKLVLKKLKLE